LIFYDEKRIYYEGNNEFYYALYDQNNVPGCLREGKDLISLSLTCILIVCERADAGSRQHRGKRKTKNPTIETGGRDEK